MTRRSYHSEELVTTFAYTERILALSGVRLIVPNTDYHGVDLSTSYGDWDELKEYQEVNPGACYVLPDLCSGSDYSGSLVEHSNYRAIIDMMPSEYTDGIEYLDYRGGHGTFGVAIRFDAMTEEMLETIEGLSDYCLIDESLHSEMERESQNEAWESDIRTEFKKALGKAMFSAWKSSPVSDQKEDETDDAYGERWDATETFLADECGDITDGDITDLFYKMTDFANVYWSNESGSGSYIDVDDVVSGGLDASRLDSDYRKSAYAEIAGLIRSGMSDTKYDLGIMRYINPAQLALPFEVSHAA